MNHEITKSKSKTIIQKVRHWIIIHKPLAIGLVAVLVIGLFFWQKAQNSSKKPTYQTAKVERGMIISTLSVSGQIAQAGNMPVTTQTSGIVKKVFVKNGDIVTSGQNLFEITPDQQSLQKQTAAWASYLSAQNNLNSANQALFSLQSDMLSKWKTYMDLAQSSSYQNSDNSPKTDQRQLAQFVSPQDDWLSTEAKYKNQQGVIAQAQAALSSSWNSYQAVSPIITAPIAGRIDDITLVLGMVISPQLNSQGSTNAQRLATVKTDTTPIASFNLPEVDVNKVKSGQKVTITLDAVAGKTFTGKVIGVDRTGAVSSGVTNYPATVQFDTQAPDVLSNMSATANIILDSKNDALLVSSSAVQTIDGQTMVKILQKGKIVQKPVEIGLTSDSQTEIVSGINEGDEVVTSSTSIGVGTSTGGSPFGAIGGRGFGGGFGGGRRD